MMVDEDIAEEAFIKLVTVYDNLKKCIEYLEQDIVYDCVSIVLTLDATSAVYLLLSIEGRQPLTYIQLFRFLVIRYTL